MICDMKREIEHVVTSICNDLYGVDVSVTLDRPPNQFGDFSTNIALRLAKQLGRNPRQVAEEIVAKIRSNEFIESAKVEGPGFINIWLTDHALLELVEINPEQSYQDQTVVAEYSDPNTFKELHAGHLYTSIAGYSISLLLEMAGAKVHRVNFGADVGLPIAKSMWGILKYLEGENPAKLENVSKDDFANWVSSRYVDGNTAYETDETARIEITDINQRIHKLHEVGDKESDFAKIYWQCRQSSYDYFNEFYKFIGTPFEKYYPESQTAPIGVNVVKKQLVQGVFEKSDGAIVFKGEQFGLHTRVFINSKGLPTYETKDIGVLFAKWDDYKFDQSIVITGNDITEYMKVVLKAVEQFKPDLVQKTLHITHGQVKLTGGIKMSSRKGNVIKAMDVISATSQAIQGGDNNEQTALGAVRYAFLKQRIGSDILYDPAESVATEGNSGPYLQYAHARAKSILGKSAKEPTEFKHGLQSDERLFARKLGEYNETLNEAVENLSVHLICTYLYELAQVFNRFYEHNRVLDDARESERLWLVSKYVATIKHGLGILNIVAPDHM
jgi:arginyl-tRNA synthetase